MPTPGGLAKHPKPLPQACPAQPWLPPSCLRQSKTPGGQSLGSCSHSRGGPIPSSLAPVCLARACEPHKLPLIWNVLCFRESPGPTGHTPRSTGVSVDALRRPHVYRTIAGPGVDPVPTLHSERSSSSLELSPLLSCLLLPSSLVLRTQGTGDRARGPACSPKPTLRKGWQGHPTRAPA